MGNDFVKYIVNCSDDRATQKASLPEEWLISLYSYSQSFTTFPDYFGLLGMLDVLILENEYSG